MITIKEEFLGSVKTQRAIELGGYGAVVLWLALKGYADGGLTGGYIPDEDIPKLPGVPRNWRKLMDALVNCGKVKHGERGPGLVEPLENAWQLHDYIDHATPVGREEERRQKERDRKANWRANRGQGTGQRTGQEAGHNTGQHRGQRTGRNTGQSDGTVPGTFSRPQPTPARNPSPPRPPEILEPTKPRPDRSEPPANGSPNGGGGSEHATKVPCPADLALLPAQRTSLEMSLGVEPWALDAMTATLRAGWLGQPSKTMPIEAWRSYLARAISSTWSNPGARPKRPGEAQGGDDEPSADPPMHPKAKARLERIQREQQAKLEQDRAALLAAGVELPERDLAELTEGIGG